MSVPIASQSAAFAKFLLRIPLLRGAIAQSYLGRLICDSEPKNGAPIFVAVHGTWAARASWTRHDSFLLNKLRAQWPDSGLYRFEWSGVNGAAPRLDASRELTRQIDHLAETYPRSEIVAIAHSHGGNVVAWASTRLKRRLAAAVYLNTPFIQVLRQDKRSHVVLQILIFFLFPILFPTLAVMLPLLPFLQRWSDSAFVTLAAAAITLVILGIMEVTIPLKMDQMRDELIYVSNTPRHIQRELVVFVVGDESSAALGAVFFTQWFGRKAIWLLVASTLSLITFSVIFPKVISEDRATGIGSWLIGAICAVLVLLFLAAMSAYGLVHGLVSLDSSIAITPAPVGEADFATISWKTKDTLRHSLIYSSPDALATILNWLQDLMRSR